ncbi:MAG TPA: SRPBCC family protein [Deltaproteobacteria bacterium]|nr:SRPBCC family protein [Deltaproteobacteria bacterium]
MGGSEPGAWIATSSALVTTSLMIALVGVYAYGRILPVEQQFSARTVLSTDIDAVWAVLGDPQLRVAWRPAVERIGQIEDRDGLEVWRELDADGDRFDFVVLERVPPRRLVLQIASPEQIGVSGSWTYEIVPVGPASAEVTVTEQTAIDNPFWRGLSRVTRDPFHTVETELELLGAYLDAPGEIQRL